MEVLIWLSADRFYKVSKWPSKTSARPIYFYRAHASSMEVSSTQPNVTTVWSDDKSGSLVILYLLSGCF